MTRTRIELVLPPWKGGVLTAWPTGLILIPIQKEINSPSWTRTNNPTVNSRVLYHWAIEDYCLLNKSLQTITLFIHHSILLLKFSSSPRPISINKLNMLPCLHLWPINLVVFKGSYSIKDEISYLEGGFTLRCLQRLSVPDLATLQCLW